MSAQELDALLRRLKGNGSRALIFTQMTRMLDVLEAFLNLHGHSYCRLDGATKPEQRQVRLTASDQTGPYISSLQNYTGDQGLEPSSGGLGTELCPMQNSSSHVGKLQFCNIAQLQLSGAGACRESTLQRSAHGRWCTRLPPSHICSCR